MGTLPPLRLGRRPVGCRLLLLYRLDPAAAQALLPPSCQPVLERGFAIAGLCYTRLDTAKSRWLPRRGSPSEHLAVRLAVEFAGKRRSERGTWILRRQTSSWIEARCGDKLLRREYERAEFALGEDPLDIALDVTCGGREELHLRAHAADLLPGSLFTGPRHVEEFLAATETARPPDVFAPEADELDLRAGTAAVEPLAVLEARSAFFAAPERFPAGAAELDCSVRLVQRRLVGVRETAPLRRRDAVIDPGGTAPALHAP
ncbi:MAG: hypothetical protein AB1726_12045 [Planctomycetota bacterium]